MNKGMCNSTLQEALQQANEFTSKREILLEFIKQDGDWLEVAPIELKSNPELMLEVLAIDVATSCAMRYLPDSLLSDKEFMLDAIKEDAQIFEYASDALKADREIALAAVKEDGDLLRFVSDKLKSDKLLVIEAVKQWGDALVYASKELQGDQEVIFASENGCHVPLFFG